MSEFPVEPSVLAWLANRPNAHVIGVSELSDEEIDDGVKRARRIIEAWAKSPTEEAFLDALASGHQIAEARRISGLSRFQADALLRRIRGDRVTSHKQL